MSVLFNLTSKTRVDTFKDTLSIDDAVKYEFDCTAWEEDNDTITGATWTVESGSAAITNKTITSGVVSGIVSVTDRGRQLISILITTASGLQKKLWLEIYVKDINPEIVDDYGIVS